MSGYMAGKHDDLSLPDEITYPVEAFRLTSHGKEIWLDFASSKQEDTYDPVARFVFTKNQFELLLVSFADMVEQLQQKGEGFSLFSVQKSKPDGNAEFEGRDG